MKRKVLIIILAIVGSVASLVLLLWAVMGKAMFPWGGKEVSPVTVSLVKLLEQTSDPEFSSYRVGTTLTGTDFSNPGQALADSMAQEWRTFDSMTEEQILVSSHLWGLVSLQNDTWAECEEAIGFALYNPMEEMRWLSKTGYFGMAGNNPCEPIKHVQVLANAAQNPDRSISQIHATAGYCTGNVRITFTATLAADTGPYDSGSDCNGYATYEHTTVNSKSGLPILIVTTKEANNTGYYNEDFFDTTAYWVKDNVFCTLRVFGDETDQEEIQSTLHMILEDI